ncbi:acyl-CoA dehydrogenase family protein [Thermodesulfobacteriota bacterium]
MELTLTEQQRMVVDTVRKFAEQEVAPQAEEADREHRFNKDLFVKMTELGLLGITIPEEYGGMGEGMFLLALVLEEISRCCMSTASALAAHYLAADPVCEFANADQKERYLKGIAGGELLCAFALTEPNAGSDVSAISTMARREGDEFVIEGRKCFITNGGVANLYLLLVRTEKAKGMAGITAFLVENETPGFSYGKEEDKMGMRGSTNRELIFENCRIPAGNLLGEDGQGWDVVKEALNRGRISTAAYALGPGQAALEASLRYANNRVQFGRPIGQFQGVQFMLADMANRILGARLKIYHAATLADSGKRYEVEASMAKLSASDASMSVTTDGVQIHGGYGYMKDFPLERYMRDAKITQIVEGTNQIQRSLIGRMMQRGSTPGGGVMTWNVESG